MDDFMLGLGIVSIIALIVSFFIKEPVSLHRIHKNLNELGIQALKKGSKCKYKLTITDQRGNKVVYPLDQDAFYYTICHFAPECEAYVDYLLELWCLCPFNLVLTPRIGGTKNTETLGLWQWNGKQHTISICTQDMEKEVMALVLIHEIAHLRVHHLTQYAYVYNLAGKKIRSPYYGMSVKAHGPQFANVFAEISKPTLTMKNLYSTKQRRHLTAYFQSPKKVHLTPLTKCGNIPVY